MRHKFFPLVVSLLIIIGVGVGLFTISTQKKQSKATEVTTEKVRKGYVKVTVEVDLTKPKKRREVLLDKEIKYSKELNAFNALKKVSGKDLGYQNGAAVYVYKIGKYSENDVHSGTGWKYYVNNSKDINKSANLKSLKSGDHLIWKFIDGY